MLCENAYFKKGIRYMLCRKVKEPQGSGLGEAAHALCGQQRFCPQQRCSVMLPGWEKCPKRDINSPREPQKAQDKPKGAGQVNKKGRSKKP